MKVIIIQLLSFSWDNNVNNQTDKTQELLKSTWLN